MERKVRKTAEEEIKKSSSKKRRKAMGSVERGKG